MLHYQVIAASWHAKGDNSYLATKGGLDFGIRSNFCANEARNGVEKVAATDNETGTVHDSSQRQRQTQQRK